MSAPGNVAATAAKFRTPGDSGAILAPKLGESRKPGGDISELSGVTSGVRAYTAAASEEEKEKKYGQQKWGLFETNYQRTKGITTEQSLQEIEAAVNGGVPVNTNVHKKVGEGSTLTSGTAGTFGTASLSSGAAGGSIGGGSSGGSGVSSGGGGTVGGSTSKFGKSGGGSSFVSGSEEKRGFAGTAKMASGPGNANDFLNKFNAKEKAKYAPKRNL